ncbi:type II toxin-antitoxin system HipA family toxin YjjJ [Sulfurirhabdus autotrophica]|uniref:HipA-like protein n=1 Tax=Sulfurirhabdus autotrophica TaxID=1706046 RepID=A0A4R3XYC5_9PROT|nr:type II toxin-antitoxin system HipA family toxin YjjJ [Sulfurirhabdus autotrophica]TCV84336.1 HipA-like protein [Sulfurirhabdus autotrophica]
MTKINTDTLTKTLRTNPRTGSAELCAKLGGISRATLTRALKGLGPSVISGGGSRRTRYALRRPLRGNTAPIPLYRIDENGQGHEIGLLSLTYPEGSCLTNQESLPWPLDKDMRDGWFEGLPYPVLDMRPQGFLGRNFAKIHAVDLSVPDSPDNWSDDDVIHTLSLMGHDQPGDLILGEAAYRRFLEHVRRGDARFLSNAQAEENYPRLADIAMTHGDAGSSAGGEFPKFTSSRLLNQRKVDVIVKFSGADNSAAVRRWSDLLICEHLAASIMANALQVSISESTICQYAGRTFLEVVRFDRHGDFGRSPVCTIGSLNAALVGGSVDWPKTVQAFMDKGWLSGEDVTRVTLIWWFGRLIGNTDMHEGNIAFRPGLTLAPTYDMLPMMYAPASGGEVPVKLYSPALPLPAESSIWRQSARAAVQFWDTCSEDRRISPNFRRICEDNSKILAHFLAR